jgi:hypothetical protein
VGKPSHIHFDPNGSYTDDQGRKFDVIDGYTFPPKPDQSKIPPSTDNPTLYHGPVSDAPPIPGGDPTKPHDVTLVNTDAMKTFAKNLDGLITDGSPLLQARDSLDQVNVKAGGFRSAVTLANNVSGSGNLRDATRVTLQNTISAIADLVDGLNRAASHYDSAEDLNNMNSQDFSDYLGQAGGQINSISGNNSTGPKS